MWFSGYFSITRPLNSCVSGLAAAVGYLIATGTVTLSSLLLIPVVVLITAAGNVINDYFDAEIDAINRPGRPIPSGTVLKSSARSFAITLFLGGILIAFYTGPLCLAIAIINTLVLILYAARFKGMPVVGNVAVSYLSGSIFLFGGAFAGTEGLYANLPLAAIAFFATLSRELLKDAEDVEGDAAEKARTLPIVAGIPLTSRVAFASALLAVVASIIPASVWGIPYLFGIALVDALILGAVIRALPCATPSCIAASKATTLLKSGFFASLVVITLAAYLLQK